MGAVRSQAGASWEITPDRITFVRHADGQLVKLGVGAFGTVRPACMPCMHPYV